jgi:glycosyltransferase involved in cell wall biosynthesis
MSGEARSVALVHDYLLIMRGAERTFAAMAQCWPRAPLFTSLYSERGTEWRFAGRGVTTSFLQRLPIRERGFRALLPLYPAAIRSLALDRYDLVVSSSSAFAHGARTAETAVHVCYCHTPFRYAWHERASLLERTPAPVRPGLRATLAWIRRRDVQAARGVTRYIANSEITRERIAACYGREAAVIHPPVEVERFAPAEPAEYFLVVSELVGHKRVETALEAVKLAGAKAVVVGSGPELGRLRARYSEVARFAGRVSDQDVARLYAGARALLVPAAEEFGIAAVESQAAGRPVVGLAGSGLRETVRDGETGVLLANGTAAEFAEAIRSVDFGRFDPDLLVRHAARFSFERFRRELVVEVERRASASG